MRWRATGKLAGGNWAGASKEWPVLAGVLGDTVDKKLPRGFNWVQPGVQSRGFNMGFNPAAVEHQTFLKRILSNWLSLLYPIDKTCVVRSLDLTIINPITQKSRRTRHIVALDYQKCPWLYPD